MLRVKLANIPLLAQSGDAPRAHAMELSCGPPAIEAILLARLI
jgi:hypothetical protein